LAFAGAFNPLLIIRNNEEILIKGDRIAIGSMDHRTPSFVNHEIDLQKGDRFYIYSDGYADQFGGENGKKMKTAVMRHYILSMRGTSMEDQRKGLDKFLKDWQGSLDQVDDICVIGVSV
jgi:serine phosphatase RsbU (regulator of sigma subunit)